MNFSELGINPDILKSIEAMGFTTPTPIQLKSIPVLLAGDRDYIGLAQTGTGKTAAFGLPLIQSVDLNNRKTQVFVLCPTRELCLQIGRELTKYAMFVKGLSIVSVYGGVDIRRQITQLKRGAHVVIGTPGRLLDHIRRKTIDLSTINIMVLDEADEMLDMGFKDDINAILANTPKQKRVWLFSATMASSVEQIAQRYMSDPYKVTVGSRNSSAANIDHFFCSIKRNHKFEALKRFIDFNKEIFGIVFCRTKRETRTIAEKLYDEGYRVDALHGDLSQSKRDVVMERFRNKKIQLLIATDVAARGIDVNGVTHVIHYTLPDDLEDYTHRSGRTGRAGQSGISIILADSIDTRRIAQVERFTCKLVSHLAVPSVEEVAQVRLSTFINQVMKSKTDSTALKPYMPTLVEAFKKLTKEELIEHFIAFNSKSFLKTLKSGSDLNCNPNDSDFQKGRDSHRLFINIGEIDQITTHNLVDLLHVETGIDPSSVGGINIKKTFSFFSVNSDAEVDQIISRLKDCVVKRRKVNVERVKSAGPQRGGRGGGGRGGRSGGGGGRSRMKQSSGRFRRRD